MTLYLGIDNGLHGAIVCINHNLEIVFKLPMPIIKGDKVNFNIQDIKDFFIITIKYKLDIGEIIIIGLEKSHTRPVQGIRQAFTTGYGLGIFEGVLTSLGYGYEIVNPSVWMREVFKGSDIKDKKQSVMFCKRKWPQEDWRETSNSKKDFDGYTDACCIAYYMYLKDKRLIE
jgi:hypothetical protein